MPPKISVDPAQAGKLIGLSRSGIYKYVKSGKLPSHVIDGRIFIAYDDLVAFVKSAPSGARVRDAAE